MKNETEIQLQLERIAEALEKSAEHTATTATLTYNLDTEEGRHAHTCAVQGKNYYNVLWELRSNFWRKYTKHAEYKHDETWDVIEQMRNEFWEMMEDIYFDEY